jgi:hypothetical protein
MRSICAHPDVLAHHAATPAGGGHGLVGSAASPGPHHHGASAGGRLNLLLSWGGWRPDSWADTLDCLLRPLGVQSMQARTARQAEQVIRNNPIHIAVVDLGLPLDVPSGRGGGGHHHEEAGCRILDLLRRMESPPPTVIVRSTRASREAARDLAAALRFNAFAVVDRTSADPELMLTVLRRCLDRCYQGRWPRGTG